MEEVKAVAVFAEPGNPFVTALAEGTFVPKKPIVVMLSGDGMQLLPKSIPYGHAGTILGEDALPIEETRKRIRARGHMCSGMMEEFYSACKQVSQV